MNFYLLANTTGQLDPPCRVLTHAFTPITHTTSVTIPAEGRRLSELE